MSERNGDLPNGWAKATIDELCDLNPKHENELSDETLVSFVPMAAVSDMLGTITEAQVRMLGEVRKGYTHFADGDVIFAKITPCMENGKAASVRGMTNGLACGTTEFYVFRSRGAIDQDFLFQFIRQVSYRKAARATMQSGVGQARVPKDFVLKTELPVPPLAEQRRIVAKIEALQERSRRAREVLAEVGPLLEQFRQSVLAAAFRGDLTADWRARHPNVEPASELLSRQHPLPDATPTRRRIQKKGTVTIPENLFHELPDTWSFATVQQCLNQRVLIDFLDGNHGELYPRKAEFGDKGVIFITATQLQGGIVDFESAPRLQDEKAKQLQKGWATGGDVLLTHNATVGRTARVPVAMGRFLLGTSVTYYRANPAALDRDYLYYVLSSPQWQAQLESIMEQTTRNQVSIQKQAFFHVPIAPIDEQREIARLLDACSAWLQTVALKAEDSLCDLEKLNQSILAKAFCGKLVPQDPSDEPASVLLDRIRAQRTRQTESAKQTSKEPWMIKKGKKWSRLEPQQLTLVEVLRTAD